MAERTRRSGSESSEKGVELIPNEVNLSGEKKFRLSLVPSIGDAIGLYGFICPILKMLPYDLYFRTEIEGSELILESDRHYFDDVYHLSSKVTADTMQRDNSDYMASLTGSRGYPVDLGTTYRNRKQLQDAGFFRRRAVKAFMSRYAKSAIVKNSFDCDLKWEKAEEGGAVLVMTSSSEGDFRRLEKRLIQQFSPQEMRSG
jgi:hypothetical protein